MDAQPRRKTSGNLSLRFTQLVMKYSPNAAYLLHEIRDEFGSHMASLTATALLQAQRDLDRRGRLQELTHYHLLLDYRTELFEPFARALDALIQDWQTRTS